MNNKIKILTAIIVLALPSNQMHCSSTRSTKKDAVIRTDKTMIYFGAAGTSLAAFSIGSRMIMENMYRTNRRLAIAACLSDALMLGTLTTAAAQDLRSEKITGANTGAFLAGTCLGVAAIAAPSVISGVSGVAGYAIGGLTGEAVALGTKLSAKLVRKSTDVSNFGNIGAVRGYQVGAILGGLAAGTASAFTVGAASYLTLENLTKPSSSEDLE